MPAEKLSIDMLRRCADAIRRNEVVRIEQPVVLMHPDTHMEIRRADARAQWRSQHRANRIARRTGLPAAQVLRQFTGETVELFGVRIVVSKVRP